MKLDGLELTLLFDYYGELLTEKQQTCFDLYYNQDLSLGEIAQETGVSRQGVHDSLTRAEATLRTMEEKTGAAARDLRVRRAAERIRAAAERLKLRQEQELQAIARELLDAVDTMKE